jgi:hypothetical protein
MAIVPSARTIISPLSDPALMRNEVIVSSANGQIAIFQTTKDIYVTSYTQEYNNQNIINQNITYDIVNQPGNTTYGVQYNNGGSFASESGFTFNPNTFTLNVPNVAVTGNTNLGDVLNITISGGSANQVLTTDGTGNVYWQSPIIYGNAEVANYLPTYTGNLKGGNANISGEILANALNVSFNVNAYTVSANFIAGDGSNLSNLPLVNNAANANYSSYANVANTAGTVTTNAQPNITSVGTLTSLSVTGNITGGNANLGNAINANYFIGAGNNLSNIQGPNVAGTVGNANLSQYLNVSDVSNNYSYHVVLSAGSGDKSLHIDADDNLQYNPNSGLLTAVRMDASIFVGNLYYSNGYPVANVVGIGNIATINLDGNSSNVLLGNGTFGDVPGIKAVIANGDSNVKIATANGNVTVSVAGSPNVGVFGTDSLTISSNIFAGNTVNAANIVGNVGNFANAFVQSTLTAVNITANTGIFTGNGGGLSNLAGANVTGTVANANYAVYANHAAYANVANSALSVNVANVANIGNVATLNLNGNGSTFLGGNGSWLVPMGLVQSTNVVTTSNVSNGYGSAYYNISFNNNTSAVLNVEFQLPLNFDSSNSNVLYGNGAFAPSYGNSNVSTYLNSLGSNNITTSGNVTATNLTATTQVKTPLIISGNNGTDGNSLTIEASDAAAPSGNGGNLILRAGTAGFSGVGGAVFVGPTNTSAVYLGGGPGYGTAVPVTIPGNLTVNGNIGTTNLNVNGVNATTLTGTLTTNAQPNITSVGNLTSLIVTGNTTVGNLIGPVANGNTNLNIPAAGGNLNISAEGNANILVVTGTGVNVAGTLNATGNANVGNLGTGGLITATGNITGGNLITAGTINASGGNLASNSSVQTYYDGGAENGVISFNKGGFITTTTYGLTLNTGGTNQNIVLSPSGYVNILSNVLAGNIQSNGQIVANSNISGLNLSTAGNVNANGNISAANISASGALSVTGNAVISGNLTVNGNITYINVTEFSVNDPIIQLQTGANGAPPTSNSGKDVGVAMNYYDTSAKIAWMGWDTHNAEISFASTATIANDIVTLTSLANLRGGNAIFGNNVSANYFTGTLTTASQPNITTLGTLSSLAVSGNITGGNVYANSGTIGASLLTGTLTTNAQPNITSVGTLTSLAVSGNLSAGNVNAGNLLNANFVTGTLTTAAQPNITSVGTLSSLAVSANVTAGNVYANSGIIGASLLTGTLTTGAQPNITSVGTLSSLAVTANISSGNVYANSGTIGASLLTGTLTTNAQPNVTSVGTLTSLNVSGNANVGNLGTAGLIVATGNVTGGNLVTGGVLSVTGNANVGNLGAANGVFTTNVSIGSYIITPGGVDLMMLPATQVTRNYGNLDPYTGGYYLGGGTRWTGIRANSADFATTLNVTGNANVGNLGTGGLITATGNITGGNLVTGGALSVTGNANVGNLGTNTAIITTGNITTINSGLLQNGNSNHTIAANGNHTFFVSGNATSQLTLTSTGANISGTANVTGNANVGNLGTTTAIITTGNITTINSGLLQNGTTNLAIPTSSGNLNVSVAGTANVLVVTASGINTSGTINSVGNANVGNLGTAGLIVATGNVTGGNLTTGGALYVTGNANTGNIGTNTAIITTGNITTINSGLLQNGNSNHTIAANGNHTFFVTGNATSQLTLSSTGANIAGTANVLGNANVGNLGTAGLIVATGNITGGNLVTGGALSVTGNANTGNLGTNTAIITTGNITTINSGLLQNGTSNHTIASGGNHTFFVAANANSQLTITSTGVNVAGTANIVGNANVGNLGTAGLIVATGNITGGNLVTGGALSVTGNANTGNLGTNTAIITTGNITTINSGLIQNGTSNHTIASGGNHTFFVAANANSQLTITSSGVNVAGTANIVGNANIGNIGTTTAIITTGNITTINSGLLQNGNSNIAITNNGNVTINAVGGQRLVLTSTGANIAGTANVTGNANVGNLGTSGVVLAGTSITTPQFISNVANGTSPIVVTSVTKVSNLNVDFVDNYTTSITPDTSAYANGVATKETIVVRDSNGNINGNNVSGTIRPTGGSGSSSGIIFPPDPGGGGGDLASIKYYANVGESTILELNVVNDADDIILLNASGGTRITNDVTITGSIANVVNITATGYFNLTGNLSANNVTGTLRPTAGSGNAGIIFPDNPVGNTGDGASIKYYGTGSGDDTVLEITVTDNPTDTIRLNASGSTNVTSNLNVAGITNLGNISNVKILGGTNGQYAQTDGTGNLVWAQGTAILTGNGTSNGANTQIQIGDGTGNFVGAAGFTFDKASNLFTTPANANVVGNLNANNNIVANGYLVSKSYSGSTEGGQLVLAWKNTTNVVNQTNSTWNLDSDSSNAFRIFYQDAGGSTGVVFTANSSTGNLTVGNVSGTIFNVSSSITTPQFISNVGTGVAPLVVSSTTKVTNLNADYLDGYDTATAATASTVVVRDSNGNVNANVFSGNNVTVTSQLTSTVATGTAPLVVSSTTKVANLNAELLDGYDTATAATASTVVVRDSNGNITGNNISGSGTISASLLTGTLTTASQPNITTVGSLTNLNVSGNAVIGGNLTVEGNIVYVNVTDLSVEDPIIQLQKGPNGAAPSSNSGKDVGTALNYYDTSAKVAWMGWDVSNTEISFGSNVTIASEVVTINTLANIRSGNAQLGNLAVANFVTGTLTTNAQPNITSVGTLTSLSVTGNVSAGNVSGTLLTGTLTTNAQPNITSVGTLTSLSVTGNVSAGNVSGTLLTGTLATAAQPNVTSVGTLTLLSVTGNVSAGNVSGTLLTGTLATAAQPNVTSVGTLTSLSVTGNGTFGNVYANSGTIGASLLTGTLTTNAQPNITSVGTLTSLSVTGNGTFGNVYANSGTIGASLVAGTLTTAAQPNITSVGTLTSLTVTGNISAGNINSNVNGFAIGYRDVPQVAASNVTIAASDAGKHYYSTTAGNLTLTIPNNATTSFATGTAISIVVQAAGNVLVNAASGVTLYMAGNSTAANRVVGTYGMATLLKVASDTWFINGTGVS